MAGPVVIDFGVLIATIPAGQITGCVPVEPALAADVGQNPSDYYVNVQRGLPRRRDPRSAPRRARSHGQRCGMHAVGTGGSERSPGAYAPTSTASVAGRAPYGTGGSDRSPGAYARRVARCSATMPKVRLRQPTSVQPAVLIRSASACWSGQARIDSAR